MTPPFSGFRNMMKNDNLICTPVIFYFSFFKKNVLLCKLIMNPKATILSIDGGGIRGVIAAVILDYIERRLQALTEDANATLADFFDLVAGTSTGGILTCFYLLPPEVLVHQLINIKKNG